MGTKNFKGRNIKIRKISKGDLKNVKKFQDFINSLVEEGAQITVNKKVSLREEISWIKNSIEKMKKHLRVHLLAENGNIIVGNTHIDLHPGRGGHVGEFGISIRKGYRGIGLGTYLAKEIIKLAKKELKPPPRIIRLSAISVNKPAISLYKKFGFKKVAKIPKQIEFKGKFVDEIIMLYEVKKQ